MKKTLVPKRPSVRGIFSTPATPSLHEWPPKIPDMVSAYQHRLDSALHAHDWTNFNILLESLQECWRENQQIFLCGNGGSAANAIHLANDFLYGVDKAEGRGLRVTALPANAAVLTCLANDVGYEDVFAQQLTVLGQPGDLLLAFSGSGNSPNIIKALTRAQEIGMTSFAVLGFTGGKALDLADYPLYFPIHDMQVSEDIQVMIGHMAMQWLSANGRGEPGSHGL
jgi:D-sedoheptulose 7-phosphate isomerase